MKILKLFISLSLILSVSLINSLAAISVSDGSAFVTKAEFAADLNNLSNRMSSLENSLDAKIDSLVSSYLSRNGIWNGEKQTVNGKNISHEIKMTDKWMDPTKTGGFQYIYSPKKMFEKLTKAGLFVFSADWGQGDYFNSASSAVISNDGAFRIKKHGGYSSEFFGMDIQLGEVLSGKTLNNDNFDIKNSFSVGTQYRGYFTNPDESLYFAVGAQVHFGACSFFVSKDSTIAYRIVAYGYKYNNSNQWPEFIYNSSYVGFRNYEASIY